MDLGSRHTNSIRRCSQLVWLDGHGYVEHPLLLSILFLQRGYNTCTLSLVLYVRYTTFFFGRRPWKGVGVWMLIIFSFLSLGCAQPHWHNFSSAFFALFFPSSFILNSILLPFPLLTISIYTISLSFLSIVYLLHLFSLFASLPLTFRLKRRTDSLPIPWTDILHNN